MIDQAPQDRPEKATPDIFPITEEHRDCSGTRHVFEIDAQRTPTGFTVTAREWEFSLSIRGY